MIKTILRAEVPLLGDVSLFISRIYLGMEFFNSGWLKVTGWENAIYQFENDFVLPLLPPIIAAHMATAGELILSVLLILGIFTPIAAGGLFIMVLVIEFFVYPGTGQHYYWMLLFGILFAYGPGRLSADQTMLKNRLTS